MDVEQQLEQPSQAQDLPTEGPAAEQAPPEAEPAAQNELSQADQEPEQPQLEENVEMQPQELQEPQEPQEPQESQEPQGTPEPQGAQEATQEQEGMPREPQSQPELEASEGQQPEPRQEELPPEAQAQLQIVDWERQKARLYMLSDDSAWVDNGIGYPCIIGKPGSRRLMFLQEGSGKALLDRPVFHRDRYQLQGESDRKTIIVWEDEETRIDWALSFTDADFTTEVWELVRGDDGDRMLPMPTLSNLGELARKLTCVVPSMREKLAAECMSPGFISALREVFHTVEDVESEQGLASLWQIVKGIFLLSNDKVTERYLKHDVFEDMLGMLEHDAGLPPNKRTPHRQVLKSKVTFKQVLSFEDARMVDRIHLNYRLQYLKDIALARLLDDGAFALLTQMIHRNLAVILDYLQKSPALLEQLFSQVRQKDRQSLGFLQDVSRLGKQLPPAERLELHSKMVSHGLFPSLVPFLSEDLHGENGREVCQACVEILLISTHNDPAHLRCFLIDEKNREFLSGLIRIVQSSEDQGVQSQVAEMLKAVMDLTLLEGRDKDVVLDAFYDQGVLDELIAPLRLEENVRHRLSPSALFAQQLACELMAFAITQHGYRARVYVIRHGVIQHAARLLSAPRRFLQLAPVRLLHAAVSSKDDAYHRYVIKCGIFPPLFRALEQSLQPPALGTNLLVSAILQVLELVRRENIKVIIEHVCTKHVDFIFQHQRISTLQHLLLKHQQNKEYEAFPPERHVSGGPIDAVGRPGRGSRMRSPGRGGDDSDDDESYFESLDDDEDDQQRPAEASVAASDAPTPAVASTAQAGVAGSAGTPDGGNDATASSLPGLLNSYAEDDERESGAHEEQPPVVPEDQAPPVAADEGQTAVSASRRPLEMPEAMVASEGQGTDGLGDRGRKVATRHETGECTDGGAGNVVIEHAPKRLKTAAEPAPACAAG